MRHSGLSTLLVLASTYPRWVGDPEPGFVHELARRLVGSFRVIVLCPHAPGSKTKEVMDGVEVVRYRYATENLETLVNNGGIVTNLKLHRWKLLLIPGFVLLQAWQAWRLCRREQVDVIHAHWLIPQGVIASILQVLPGRRIPFLVTSHGADLFALRAWPLSAIKRFVLRRAARATVVSEAMRIEVGRLLPEFGKASVISMGVDMAGRFVPTEAVPRSACELLFVGRLVEKKGLRHLLDALPMVLLRRPEVSLAVAGFGPDEVLLKAQVRALGLEQAVRFIGAVKQEELPAMYQRAALFVAPFVQAASGDQEGLGLVLLEAIGCGCPVLAGDVPAVADILEEAWRIDARDPQRLAERIVSLLENHVAVLGQVQHLRERLLPRYGWHGVADRYEAVLDETLRSVQ